MQEAGRQRPRADANQDHRQEQREHGAESSEQNRKVPEPEDLQPHRRETRHRERKADQGDGNAKFRIWNQEFGIRATHSRFQIPNFKWLRQPQGTEARDHVEEHRDVLRGSKAQGRHQHEVRQKTSQRRARGIHGVQNGDPPAAGVDVASEQMTNEQRQRCAHQQCDRREQDDRDGCAEQIRG